MSIYTVVSGKNKKTVKASTYEELLQKVEITVFRIPLLYYYLTEAHTFILIQHVNEYPTMHHDCIWDFDWVLQEIPLKNCIVGMLLTCPIIITTLSWFINIEVKLHNQAFWQIADHV